MVSESRLEKNFAESWKENGGPVVLPVKETNTKKETHMKKTILATVAFVFFGFAQAHADDVQGYTRKDGTHVAPYQRTSPDHNPYNNYNFPGNYNPNTGSTTPGNADTYLNRYNNNNQGQSSGGLGSSDLYNSRRR
jgi:hypothetical protein